MFGQILLGTSRLRLPVSDTTIANVLVKFRSVKQSSKEIADNIVSKNNNQKNKQKMKKWPEAAAFLAKYDEVIGPLKTVLNNGYRLIRNNVNNFEYTGYNIGDTEAEFCPSPKERLTEQYLAIEKEAGRTLCDVILNIAFLLGIEQGRRLHHKSVIANQDLLNTLEKYRRTNHDLLMQIDELELAIELLHIDSSMSIKDRSKVLEQKMQDKKKLRLERRKEELALDPSRSSCVVPK